MILLPGTEEKFYYQSKLVYKTLFLLKEWYANDFTPSLLYLCYFGFLLFRFTKGLITEDKKGIIEFCLIISLLFPLVGLIVSAIMLLLNIRRSKTEWLQQYSEYVSFQVDHYEDILASAKQDMIISFSSGLELDKPELHKQLIVQLSSSLFPMKEAY